MLKTKCLLGLMFLAQIFIGSLSRADTLEEYGVRFTSSSVFDRTTNQRWIRSVLASGTVSNLGTISDVELFLLDGWRVATVEEIETLLYRGMEVEPGEENNPLVNVDFINLWRTISSNPPNTGIPFLGSWACMESSPAANCSDLSSDSFTQVDVSYFSVNVPGEPGLHVSLSTYQNTVPLFSDEPGVVCELCEDRVILVRDSAQPGADIFPPEIEIADVIGGNGTDGVTLFGRDFQGQFGYQVAPAGDINGDGIDDVFIGAHREDPNEVAAAGTAYVIYGRDSGFPAGLQLFDDAVGTGEFWFRLDGIELFDSAGYSIASGDINGDGLSDLVIGAWGASAAYVVYGQNGPFPPAFQLSELFTGDGVSGFVLDGTNAGSQSGRSVAVGNVNGDDFDDVIVGNADSETFVYYGRETGIPAVVDLADIELGNGDEGFKLSGAGISSFSPNSISAADINGDSLHDLIVGVSQGGQQFSSGITIVVFGNASNPSLIDFADDIVNGDGTLGFFIQGLYPGGNLGESVSAGDFNSDGIDDLLIGSYSASPNGAEAAGESYLVYGRSSGFPVEYDLLTLLDNPDNGEGSIISGYQINARSGRTVGALGDINADGYEDIAINSIGYDSNSQVDVGRVHIIYGSSDALPASIQLAELENGDGSGGFVVNGHLAEDFLGIDVNTVGDVNHDGVADYAIGAVGADTNSDGSGEVYVLFGRAPADSDNDGVVDSMDNCIETANPSQRDTDGDGFGNYCDPDLNNDGIVNFADIALWVPFFNAADEDADLDGDGNVNFIDYAILTNFFLQPPGPSGL